ncbi:hypothetical protein LGV61_08980 [Desulfurispirillum indicum]|uniref:Na+/H+ antiporter n=1 Tax=Desulfurispirillum indicum (strain ATCC BAA-1389 / DSM 22839 / S5) TaxID=653733 RepID=E6W1I5_DESIS|nr:putative Na+/H+ antiporter [Desulfurispirillum indicum]ADU66534.1 protein of unknown function DUF1504 [Desulfurispirillum indicum S5]UCZ55855.1 hypothetical protein LGV61_08980 [Desulfurispirillum indicum]
MTRFSKSHAKMFFILLSVVGLVVVASAASSSPAEPLVFPRSLESYGDADNSSVLAVLAGRIAQEPFNLVATLIFLCAIIHTFMTSKFLAVAHKWEHEHEHKKQAGKVPRNSIHFGAGVFHFLGEVEAVFGIWAIALAVAIGVFYDFGTFVYYIGQKVDYTEPLFVVIIMTLAATRPILKFSELMMWKVANFLGGTLSAWWLTILTIGPLLGSFITEPAAMTISALLLSTKFYNLKPSESFKYATIGLLFVNISVGGTLSHFAAPPVLMVASTWDWGFGFMFLNFGWKAVIGIVIANALYFYLHRNEMRELEKRYALVRMKREIERKYVKREQLEDEFAKIKYDVTDDLGFIRIFDERCDEIRSRLKKELMERVASQSVDKASVEEAFDVRFYDIKLKVMRQKLPGLLPADKQPPYRDPYWDNREDWVPAWIMVVHMLFLVWTVATAHYPALFIAGFLFLLGFVQVTTPYQNRIDLKPALLVGFFLAGLVIHGGVQAWWIAPVLGSLTETPLMLGATLLTAFNDNAAITYLSTFVPGITDTMKYAVVAGAVTGGGLTVIANAPNPAGQSILGRHFKHGAVSPLGLLKAALVPTVIMGLCFMLLRF